MVIPVFANLEIDIWVHPGKLGLSQPSICLFHDTLKTGTQFVEALAELRSIPCPAKRTLTFTTRARKSPLRRLTLLLVAASDDVRVMNIRSNGESATIEMTEVGRSLLVIAFSTWLAGSEDFGISPRHSDLRPKEFGRLDRESGELWFWGPRYAGP